MTQKHSIDTLEEELTTLKNKKPETNQNLTADIIKILEDDIKIHKKTNTIGTATLIAAIIAAVGAAGSIFLQFFLF